MSKLKLGSKGKDKLTGFKGILYGRSTYLTGCDQYCLVPKAKKGELQDAQWFDDDRVEIIGEGISAADVTGEKNGGPQRREAPRV